MKFTRRRILIGSTIAVAVIGGAWFAIAEREPPFGVTWSAFRAIRFGMTKEEVNRIVGHTGALPWWRIPRGGAVESQSDMNRPSGFAGLPGDVMEWDDGENLLQVDFNKEGLVCEKTLCYQRLEDRLLRQVRSFWGKLGF